MLISLIRTLRLSNYSLIQVRKRSQSDAKSPPSIDKVSSTPPPPYYHQSSNGSYNNNNNPPESPLPLYMKKLNGSAGGSPGDSLQVLSKSRASSLRKHLSHSISEENDEVIYTEMSADGLAVRRMNRMLSESSDTNSIFNKSKVVVRTQRFK